MSNRILIEIDPYSNSDITGGRSNKKNTGKIFWLKNILSLSIKEFCLCTNNQPF